MGALYTNHDCILMKGAEWPNTGFSALVGFGTIYCSSHNDPIRWKRSDQRLWQTGQSLQLYAYYQDFSNNYAPPGRCLCVFHSKWIRIGAKMDFFAKSHPRGDRHTVYAQNRTRGATVIQFMRRMKTPGAGPRALLFLSKRRKGLTHPLRQSLFLTRIPADCRLGKYPC